VEEELCFLLKCIQITAFSPEESHEMPIPRFKVTVRPFVSEILSFKRKRTLFHSITDIDATAGRTANQRAVLKSGEHFLQDAVIKPNFYKIPQVWRIIIGQIYYLIRVH
ncbi:hypothetical protein PV325_005685, partial [Microctonus aethiopoides]